MNCNIQQIKHEIAEIQARILELLQEQPGGQVVENEEYQQLRARLTELQNLVRQYEVERVFGYCSYPIQYCRCPVPEISADNRQHPARCLKCGRAVPKYLYTVDDDTAFYQREVLTFIAFILVLALLTYIYLTGGLGL